MVLHGTSGVPEEQVTKCINLGMAKVNYATDLRIAYTHGVKEYMKGSPAFGMEEVKNYVIQKMNLLKNQKF